MDVKVTGADSAAAAFARMAVEVERLDLSRVGDQVQDQLQTLSPQLTGALSRSWSVDVAPGRVSVGSELIYASVQNYGGYHNIVGQHFIERSTEHAEQETERIVADELDRLIDRL